MTDFEKFANLDRNISSMTLHRYGNVMDAYINPSIIEERKLNIAAMDVFSRLMMDRIIFLGVAIDPDVANIVQAQLLYLSSVDDRADISLYLNTPGGLVSAGLGIYDTMQLVKPDVSTICTGMAASMGAFLLSAGTKGKRYALPNAEIMIHQPLGAYRGQATDIEIHAKNPPAKHLERSTFTARMSQLPNFFVKVNRSVAVNMMNVDSFTSECVYFTDSDESVPVSKSMLPDIKKAFYKVNGL